MDAFVIIIGSLPLARVESTRATSRCYVHEDLVGFGHISNAAHNRPRVKVRKAHTKYIYVFSASQITYPGRPVSSTYSFRCLDFPRIIHYRVCGTTTSYFSQDYWFLHREDANLIIWCISYECAETRQTSTTLNLNFFAQRRSSSVLSQDYGRL